MSLKDTEAAVIDLSNHTLKSFKLVVASFRRLSLMCKFLDSLVRMRTTFFKNAYSRVKVRHKIYKNRATIQQTFILHSKHMKKTAINLDTNLYKVTTNT